MKYPTEIIIHNKEYIDLIKKQSLIFKALGHPTRLRIVDFLRQGEKCVCDLQELIGDDISTISRHLSILKEANIISSERRKNFIYYALVLECLSTFLDCTRNHANKN